MTSVFLAGAAAIVTGMYLARKKDYEPEVRRMSRRAKAGVRF